MKFARLEMLLLVWSLPVLFLVALYGMKRRRRLMREYMTLGMQAINCPGVSDLRRWVKISLLLGALLFAFIGLSGPQYGYNWKDVEQKGVDIIIALDLSRSMLAEDIKPTRIDRAKREIYDLISHMQGDRVGLVAFAGTAFLQCPLTLDYSMINLFLKSLSADYLPVGGTNLAAALEVALGAYKTEDNTEKALILITDGEDTGADPEGAVRKAKAAGVKIFCIGVGHEEGAPLPVSGSGFQKDQAGRIIISHLDEAGLKKMAVSTGGAYVRSVAGDMDLDVIYTKEIRGKMEAAVLKGGRRQIWEDRYQWALCIAVILLIAELLIAAGRKPLVMLLMVATMLIIISPSANAKGFSDSNKQGVTAYNARDYERALKHFIDTQLIRPEDPRIIYNIGNAYYKLGNYEAARRHYSKLLKSENSDIRQKSYYNLGNAEYRLQKFDEAIESYKAALEIDPKDENAQKNMEFVKKMKAMRQKQKKQKKQENQKKQDGGDTPRDEPSEGQGPQNKPSREKEKTGAKVPSEANPKAPDAAPEAQQTQPAPTPSPKEADTPPESQGQGLSKKEQGPPGSHEWADRMLRRLKDQPGRGLMPPVQSNPVVKDW